MQCTTVEVARLHGLPLAIMKTSKICDAAIEVVPVVHVLERQ